jgi:hypothetical protein
MTYKISDSVWHRVVQIIQEAMLTGVDCADLLRQVRVQVDTSSSDCLVLSEAYQKQVEEMHAKYLAEIQQKKSESSNILIND